MKKILLIGLLSFSISFFAKGQTNFSSGFLDGYKKGYCYGQVAGCVIGVVPVTPIPDVNESLNSYLDGYNRGFLKGKADGDDYRVSQQKNSPFNGNDITTPYQGLSTTIYHPDLNFFQQMLANAEAQYETEHRQNNNVQLTDHDQQVISQLSNPDHIQMQESYIKFLKLYYSQLKVLPATIPDGVYDVMRITGTRDVEQAKVIVKHNKITEISTKMEILMNVTTPFRRKLTTHSGRN